MIGIFIGSWNFRLNFSFLIFVRKNSKQIANLQGYLFPKNMLKDYYSFEIDGHIIFEKLKFEGAGRQTKILDNNACFMFMIKGGLEIRSPIDQFTLGAGGGFLTKCGEYFFEDMQPEGTKPKEVEAIGIYFHPKIVREAIELKSEKWSRNLTKLVEINSVLEVYKNSILELMLQNQLFDREMMLLKLKELILILSASTQAPSVHHFISALYTKHEFDFRTIIEQNATSSLNLEQFAFLSGMSLASFKRKFSKYYQQSPAQYFRKKKLEKALGLLLNTKLQINQIAFDCGFETLSAFNRSFKTQYSISPSEYRMSHKDHQLS